MDEILLTHDQQGDAIDTALARCTRDKELSPVHTVAEEVCRAQVRKVWREIQASGHYSLSVEIVAALREAAGEGK